MAYRSGRSLRSHDPPDACLSVHRGLCTYHWYYRLYVHSWLEPSGRSLSAPAARHMSSAQDMHAHSVDTMQLAANMEELQRAHTAQSALLQGLEERSERLPVLKSTASKQQQVIRHLEGLLKRTVADLKTHKDSSRDIARLTTELARLREVRATVPDLRPCRVLPPSCAAPVLSSIPSRPRGMPCSLFGPKLIMSGRTGVGGLKRTRSQPPRSPVLAVGPVLVRGSRAQQVTTS